MRRSCAMSKINIGRYVVLSIHINSYVMFHSNIFTGKNDVLFLTCYCVLLLIQHI